MTSAAALMSRVLEAYHHDEFMAFSMDPDTRAMLAEFAAGHDWPASAVQEGGVTAAAQFLGPSGSPRRLLVDLGDHPDPVGAMTMLRDSCARETAIIALGNVNDIALLRNLLRAGASDYLIKPVTLDALEEAVERACQHHEAAPDPETGEQRKGRLVAFVGARGGTGTSTLAMNSAWLLAHEGGHRVALVDLDLRFGTVALNLDLEPSHGLVEALQNPGRVDGLFIASAMVNESENLFVLAAEEPLEAPISFDPEASDLLFDELCHNFDCVVVDLPGSAVSQHRGLLAHATDILVVSTLSLPCVRDVMRVLSFAKECAPTARRSVIANQVRPGNKGQISKRDFERGIEVRVDHVVPEDAKASAASANSGKPLAVVARHGGIVRALRKLDFGLPDKSKAKGRTSLWRRSKR